MSKNANRLVDSLVPFRWYGGLGVVAGKNRRLESVHLDVTEACVVWLRILEFTCDDIRDVVSPGTFRAAVAKNTGTCIWAATECTGRLDAAVWIEFLSGSFTERQLPH